MLSNIGNIFMMEHNLFRGEQKLSIFFIHFTSLVKAILTSLPKTKQYPFTSHLSPIIPTLANLWQFTMWLQYWAGAGVWAAESCWHSGITYCYNLCLIWLVTGAMRHRPSPYLKWDPQTLQAAHTGWLVKERTNLKVQGVQIDVAWGVGLLQECFRSIEVTKGFLGTTRTGVNYI